MLEVRRGDRDFSLGSNGVPDRDLVEDPHEMSMSLSDRNRHHSTASLIDAMERRTQKTYRYGIGLVCVGATLNWLGFAQGHGYIDPLRYLGVACVISGSFCVCLAMCRWLGRPISVASHRDEAASGRNNGDVHVINVAVPMYVPPMHEEYRPAKPPDYEIVAGEPPPYDEAIKLSPGALFSPTEDFFSSCQPSPSHSSNLTCALIQNEVVDPTVKRGRSHSINPNNGAPPPYEATPQEPRRHSTITVSNSLPITPQIQTPGNHPQINANQNLLLNPSVVRGGGGGGGGNAPVLSPNPYHYVQTSSNSSDVQSSVPTLPLTNSNILLHPRHPQSDDNLLNIVSINNNGNGISSSGITSVETQQNANSRRTFPTAALQLQPQIHQSPIASLTDQNNGNGGFSSTTANG